MEDYQRTPEVGQDFTHIYTQSYLDRVANNLKYLAHKEVFHYTLQSWLVRFGAEIGLQPDQFVVSYNPGGHGVCGDTTFKTSRWRIQVGSAIWPTHWNEKQVDDTDKSGLCVMFRMLKSTKTFGNDEGPNHWASLRWLVECGAPYFSRYTKKCEKMT